MGEIGEIVTGSTPPTNDESYYGGEHLFVSPADIQTNRYVNNSKTTLTLKGFRKGRKVKKGSSLFVCIGSTIGKVAQASEDCVTNQQINSIVSLEHNADFVFSLLEFSSKKIKLLSAEQAVPIINKTTFSNFQINIPSLSEQAKIASFLSIIDERIQTQNKIIEGLGVIKSEIIKKIFSQNLRFKVDNQDDFSVWKKRKLGDIAVKKSSNISANSLEENQGEYKVYGASGLLKLIDFYKEIEPYIAIVKDGAGVGKLFLCEKKSSVLGTLDIIKNKEMSDLKFLYYLLSTLDFSKFTTGSTIPHIYFKDYSNEIIGLPTHEEQLKIANFFSLIDSKIDIETQFLNKLEEQKKFLLQQMFV
ncbi:MAG: restriction endonuclease subunit S [Bacteroidetes bacterium]|nr:restriction endonuclease subunit S [Bacteroidota bacterium]